MDSLSHLPKHERVDLHVHSMYSEPSTEWFMHHSKIAESYSDPLFIYETAKRAGMTLVTVTDHNSIDGCLLLKERYGDDVIMGVETTAMFPEDKCKIHLLIYGLSEREFAETQRLRNDIYELRAYIKEVDLAHSVAHATFPVTPGKLTVAHLERLIVLFSTFEIINGGRDKPGNLAWRHILESLTPDHLENLCRKHSLEPFDAEPWIKGFTAGSDDHGGIFIGRTMTSASVGCSGSFLEALKGKKTTVEGRHSDYCSLVFSIYKVVHDFSRHSAAGVSGSLITQLAEVFFDGKRVGLANRIRLQRLKARARKNDDAVYASLAGLAEGVKKREFRAIEEGIEAACAHVADLSDNFLKILLGSIGRNTTSLDLPKLAGNIQASLPGVFLALPFLLAVLHLNQNRPLAEKLASTLNMDRACEGERILWFTDTLHDLNGVSITLSEISRTAHDRDLGLKLVASVDADKLKGMPPNVINLPAISQFTLPYYESYTLKIPSLLMSLKTIYDFDPDTIYISTPGPVGLLGLLVAKLMNVRSVGIYHTDFTLQARELIEDEAVSRMLESFTRWFYSAMDEIKVPTLQYIAMLEERGFDPRKLSRFRRGVDLDRFTPSPHTGPEVLRRRFGVRSGVTLLYAGRVSADKGLDMLMEAYSRVASRRPDVNLLIVGTGPQVQELQSRYQSDRVIFAGMIDNRDLPDIYAASDLFVFPSVTDTFGRAVLEAQACGLPAIVSDQGGPQEIIVPGRTGLVARGGSISGWVERIEQMLFVMEASPASYRRMREEARTHVIENYDWDDIIDSLFFDRTSPPTVDRGKKVA